jgi:hypothetical protein
MTSIIRRQLIADAPVLLGETHLPLAFAARQQNTFGTNKPETLNGPPQNLLSYTFTPALLSNSLASASVWHPYPKTAPTLEKIALKDDDLRRIWGESIYRVPLTSTQPTDSGKWVIEIG